MRLVKYLLSLALTAFIAACGGGGGDPGTPTNGCGNNCPPSGNSSSATVSVAIFDASGVQVSTITSTGTFTARAVVKSASGVAVPSTVVNFSVSGASIAVVSPNSALTNSSGVAEVPIVPSSPTSAGAASLVASVSVGGANVSGQVDFAVQSTGVSSAPTLSVVIFDASGAAVTTISAGGQFTARATLKAASGAPVPSTLITFSLAGVSIAGLSPSTALTNNAGVAEVAIAPLTPSSAGAASLLASALVSGTGVSGKLDFAVQASSVVTVPTLKVIIVDATTGATVNSMSLGGRYTARATVKGSTGLPAASTVVTFGLNGPAIAGLNPNTALTNSAGIAEVSISPLSISSAGAGTLSANAAVSGSGVSGQFDFAVQPSTVVTNPSLTVSIIDGSGASVNAISVGGAYIARAVVKDANRLPVASTAVTFSLGGASIANLNPTTALTNSSGVAEVAISPASLTSVGAASLSASSQVAGASVFGQLDFAVQASSLSLSSLVVGSPNLQSGGNTPIQVTALIGGAPATGISVNVSFTASCGRINGQDTGAGGVSVTTSGGGIASAVYDAISDNGSLCSGPVTITASSPGATPQTTTVNVAAPVANAVTFLSATPSQIFVAGSGAVEQSIARFIVRSSAGTPMPNVAVRFSISVNPGGVGLGASGSVGSTTATTSATGEAAVSVFSGTIPGPVKVRAELVSNPSVFSESQNLTVASGPPSQRYMSFAVETFNIEGWSIDGTATQLTVRVADRQGNAVEDGTVVNFTAEGGQVARSCATARVGGISQCSVSFQSQNPRPAGGRASVLAYLEGTKDYVDVNGNNRYDAGVDTLVNIGDAYRDDNENGIYDSSNGEFLIPRLGTGVCPSAGAPFPSRLNTCDGSLATTVRQQAVVLFSSSSPLLTPLSVGTTGLSFQLSSLNNPLLPLPAGTTVTAEALDVSSADGLNCSIAGNVFGSPIPNVNPGTNPNANLSTSHGVALKDCLAGDVVKINVRVPSGLTTVFSFTL